MILDCRKSNREFAVPPGVSLLSGEGFARIEIAEEELDESFAAWLGVSDVKDCFHRLRFPPGSPLREYFAYPAVRAGEVGVTELGGVAVSPETVIYPVAAVLPMGWAWSLYFP